MPFIGASVMPPLVLTSDDVEPITCVSPTLVEPLIVQDTSEKVASCGLGGSTSKVCPAQIVCCDEKVNVPVVMPAVKLIEPTLTPSITNPSETFPVGAMT